MKHVVIIGAGPAGLAAAQALHAAGRRITLYDAGKGLERRAHDSAEDLGRGIGGAGLFSDGKFSFYPSGTHVYRLARRSWLRDAYDWCFAELQNVGIGAEPFPLDGDTSWAMDAGVKKYPSHYGSLDQRKQFVKALCSGVEADIRTETTVVGMSRIEGGYTLQTRSRGGVTNTETCSAVILATGRFGALDFQNEQRSPLPASPLRYEFGIRVESHKSRGFLSRMKPSDVKRMWTGRLSGLRTFCTCREGEIWNLPFDSLAAISGRSDGPSTNYSNFGLLARFENEQIGEGRALWNELSQRALKEKEVTFEPLRTFLGDGRESAAIDPNQRPWYPVSTFRAGSIRKRVGDGFYRVLVDAVRALVDWSPDLDDPETVCLFPAVEGVGSYPRTDDNLRVLGHDVWCVGDVAGRFRGLIPGLLSGYYAGLAVAETS